MGSIGGSSSGNNNRNDKDNNHEDDTIILQRYLQLDQEGQQEIVFHVLKTFLPQLPNLDEEAHEHILTLWLRCLEWGMEDVLIVPVLQSLFPTLEDAKERRITIEELAQDPSVVMEKVDLKFAEDRIFWRIFSFAFLKLRWFSRQSNFIATTFTATATTTNSNFMMGDVRIIKHLLDLATSLIDKPICVRRILLLLHQIYLEDSQLINFSFKQNLFPGCLYKHLLVSVPSLHVLLEPTIHRITMSPLPLSSSFDQNMDEAWWWAILFAHQYPMPKTLGLVESILEKCKELSPEQLSARYLKIVVGALTAFPTTMSKVAPLLVNWMAIKGDDAEFISAATQAAQEIHMINQAVAAPIYQRPPLVVYSSQAS